MGKQEGLERRERVSRSDNEANAHESEWLLQKEVSESGRLTGPGEVRFIRRLPGPIERVWKCVTDPGQRARWCGDGMLEQKEWRVNRCEPPHLLAFTRERDGTEVKIELILQSGDV